MRVVVAPEARDDLAAAVAYIAQGGLDGPLTTLRSGGEAFYLRITGSKLAESPDCSVTTIFI